MFDATPVKLWAKTIEMQVEAFKAWYEMAARMQAMAPMGLGYMQAEKIAAKPAAKQKKPVARKVTETPVVEPKPVAKKAAPKPAPKKAAPKTAAKKTAAARKTATKEVLKDAPKAEVVVEPIKEAATPAKKAPARKPAAKQAPAKKATPATKAEPEAKAAPAAKAAAEEVKKPTTRRRRSPAKPAQPFKE